MDYLVIGHTTQDVVPTGLRLGGTVVFSALTARALGLRVGIVTAAAPDLSLNIFDGITVVSIPSEHTTTYENIYGKDGRKQVLHHQAAHIPFESVPEAWRSTSILHLGPLAQELDAQLPKSFAPSLLGITPQGWMRKWNAQGRVSPCASAWESAELLLPQAGAVVISREDVSGNDELIESMANQTRVLVVTEGEAGAVLYWNGDRRRFSAPQMNDVDSTGAGDIFAAAFFFRMFTTRDPWEAGRFATQLAARSVLRVGLNGIPTQKEINDCLMEVI
ncbi:MAG: PfkB family carbohydrate kinase [Anaerolineales bacterium]|nr:PfkB family carbohydrate kinase [Anaerolineales bacterium]